MENYFGQSFFITDRTISLEYYQIDFFLNLCLALWAESYEDVINIQEHLRHHLRHGSQYPSGGGLRESPTG